ncbi:MAG: DNA mismatch repair protein MutS, partial [Sarcina sp.]
QYFEVKDRYEDCILFYRLGDFYEMFFEDAKLVSKELELVLTGRECGLESKAPMCGVPYHASKAYISRLIAKGYKVAICEQIEDPAKAKGIVKRDVVKIITPGTYSDESDSEYKNTYMSAVFIDNEKISISSSDIATGEFKVTSFNYNISAMLDELSKIAPKEVIVDKNISDDLLKQIEIATFALITKRDFSSYEYNIDQLDNTFKFLNKEELDVASINVSIVLLNYINDTQKMSLSNINHLEIYYVVNYMSIDSNSRRNLELVESLKEKNKKGSLIWVMDKTSTAMGARTLRKWIEEPLIIKTQIEDRLSSVEELFNNIFLNEDLRDVLKSIYDIERIVGKISSNNVNGKDLLSLKTSLEKLPLVKDFLEKCTSVSLKKYYESIDILEDIQTLLENSILEEAGLTIKDGNIIKSSYNDEIKKFREAKTNGTQWIAAVEAREREFTGIKSLKVGFNKVFGYYIEISKSNYSAIPEGRYIRKQTLANAERFITQELKEVEEQILGAEEKLATLEYDLFIDIRNQVESQILRLQKAAKIVGELDVLSTFALIAKENSYVKPSITSTGEIKITNGRHPVVEKVIPNGEFISNDTIVDTNDNQMLLITGPNMAGKSTYMRQVALITIMAQIGSFVPAENAQISICDKVFTRIGASDDLAGGKSTFMVEMWEVSNIIKNATANSLVLLDEVGRGTSTYDGLSIAWSVIEHISKKIRCKTLFATHYHELTKLEGIIKGVKNYSVSVKELDDNIIFLRKIIEGGADQSYGIEVAKLAGIPKEVISRAKEILFGLEDHSISINVESNVVKDEVYKNCDDTVEKENIVEINETVIEEEEKIQEIAVSKTNVVKEETLYNNVQIGFDELEKDNIINKIKEIDMASINMMDAMNILYKLYTDVKNIK